LHCVISSLNDSSTSIFNRPFFLHKDGFSNDDKEGWSAYLIVKEHPTKTWYKWSVQRLINKFKEEGTMEKKERLRKTKVSHKGE